MGVPGLNTFLKQYAHSHYELSELDCMNLYIDMNGIIHPACYSSAGYEDFFVPENMLQESLAGKNLIKRPKITDEERFQQICQKVDEIVKATSPKNIVYLAIDGVSPRAKMNHQRARRYRRVMETGEREEVEHFMREERKNMDVPSPLRVGEPWDSNQISPGTLFMTRLNAVLKTYIEKKVNEDKDWKHLTVILSDSSGLYMLLVVNLLWL